MPELTLTDGQYKEILRLARYYRREAERCRESKAFLAGCVMTGAALESMLLAIANCFPEEALSSKLAPRRGGAVKPLVDWSLAHLLSVTKERGWLPSGLSLDDEWDDARAEIADYAEVIRQIRNLIHPSRYAEGFLGKRITKRYLESSFEILDAANDFLMNKVAATLERAREEEERRA